MTTLQEIAAEAEKVVEVVGKVATPILTGVSIFVPGATAVTVPLQAILPLLLPDLERALNDVVAGNNGDIFSALLEFANHMRAGMPNSAILSATPAAAVAASIAQDGLDASKMPVG